MRKSLSPFLPVLRRAVVHAAALCMAAAAITTTVHAQTVSLASTLSAFFLEPDRIQEELPVFVQEMRADLASLVESEKEFRLNYGSYTADLAFAGHVSSDDVSVEMLWATEDGWAARASHRLEPGMTCVVWAGLVPADESVPATTHERKRASEGLAACDGDGVSPAESERRFAIGEMRATLWRAVEAERRHLIEQPGQGYTAELVSVDGFAPREGVTTLVLWAGKSWAAQATHPGAPGRSCVVWLGEADRSLRPGTQLSHEAPQHEGEVLCDR
ncbi:MAG: hypothetical protein ACRENI_00295 [Gemmatimonadaceae bacterium]